MSQGLYLPAGDPFLAEKGCGHSQYAVAAASTGRAFCLEQGQGRIPGPGDEQNLAGSQDKGMAHVSSQPVHHPGPVVQDSGSVPADQFGGRSRCGESTELLRADRDPVEAAQQAPTFGTGFALPVVAGAEADQAGRDQAGRVLLMIGSHEGCFLEAGG